MKKWLSQLWLQFKQSQSKPEKCFQGFNGVSTHGLCLSAAVLYHLSYEDPYVGRRPIYGIHRTRERNETYEYYLNCGHTNEMKKWSTGMITSSFHSYVRSSHNIQNFWMFDIFKAYLCIVRWLL